MSFRPRSAAGVASLALVSLLGLSACTSTPSHRRVVIDQIDALDQLDGLQITDEQQACMRAVVGTYENGELDDIATAGDNEDINWNDENALASGSPELQDFVERLGGCMTEGAETPDTTEASDTTDA